MARIIDCISDDKLQEVAFGVHLKRAAALSTGNIYDPMVYEQVKYAIQVSWGILNRSSRSSRWKFATCVANEPQLIGFTLSAMSACLESHG